MVAAAGAPKGEIRRPYSRLSAVPPTPMRTALVCCALLAAGCVDSNGLHLRSIETPAAAGSLAPGLSLGADGRVRLTWTEPAQNGEQALRFAVLQGERWSSARTIAQGRDWFVNWADVPALAALEDGTLLATWLAKLGSGTYAYGAFFARSSDAGATWSAPRLLHEDSSPGEHGFVSLAALDADTFRAVWLDGRAAGGGHGSGAMQLYSRTIGRDGSLGPEAALDERVCDCCPTALSVLADGAVAVAYRDRGEDELRDVSVVRIDGDGAKPPAALHDDGWIIDGCPVNGPALAVQEDRLAAVWFTRGRDDQPRVLAAFSSAGGAHFGAPLLVDAGALFGSVAACFDAGGTLWVSWLGAALGESNENDAWRLRGIDEQLGPRETTWELAQTGAGRAAGIARLVALDAGLLLAWTEVGRDGATRVRTQRVTPPGR
jgi:hypothetical protein